MIKQLTSNSDKTIVINYISKYYFQCLYLYLDIIQYDIEQGEILVFIQYNTDSISSVMLKYHNAIHLYSKENNFNVEELALKISSLSPYIICAKSDIIKTLVPLFPTYSCEIGVVARLYDIKKTEDTDVTEATENEFENIAQLVYEDNNNGASYDLNDLIVQMKERYNKHFSRNYIIKKENQIVANVSTGGECERFCTINNVIVRKEERNKGYAKRIYKKLCSQLLYEGKEVYSIYYVKASIGLHEKLGFREVCKYGKLYIHTH